MPIPSPPFDHIADDGDDLVFMDELTGAAAPAPAHAWRIMIVDEDADVHATTTFALASLELQGRPFEFVHAYSASEARALLERERDLAVILLDVVMEQADAGLHLVRHIRETLKLADVRIILRTGQPGYAPEIDAVCGYDINDYRVKSELTRTRLFTTVAAAIRSYEQIRSLQASRIGLAQIVRASTELMALHGLTNFVRGVLDQVVLLLAQAPDGLLCARAPAAGAAAEPLVMAAVGPCSRLQGRPLAAQGDPLMAAAIGRTLAERRSLYHADYLTLYFPTRAGADFAACLRLARPVGETEQHLLAVFCSHVAVGLDNVALVSHLHTAAFYDPLTGLPNRTRLAEILHAILTGPDRQAATLALVDLDHFAMTNDALGHQFGDLLLVAVAERLQSRLDPRLTVARIGGDIFCVLGDASEVDPAALLELFQAPFLIDGEDVPISATIGLVRLSEHEGHGADALKDADIALKRAKLQQRAGYFYFSRSMGVEIRERVRMMHALRSGYRHGELYLVYQPQVDLATRTPVGAEALLRWRTQDGQLVTPDRFIPIAEYSGLIIEIGEWVLRHACEELVRLRQAGYRGFTMSVNVSQVQFRHPRFLDILQRTLDETGAPHGCIELEITESMAMEEPELLIELLIELKRIGVSIAIDDFGTGFSSLSHLQRLQVDRLKIDRAFVTEITSSARGSRIAEMVVKLGHNLGLSIVAEGVEEERQVQILQALGCPLAQGFLFARPMPAPALLEWLGKAAPGRPA